MLRKMVRSSSLHSVGYDYMSESIEIEFKDGSVYQYAGVSPSVYKGLMKAFPSYGEYFDQHIKGQYPGSKIQ